MTAYPPFRHLAHSGRKSVTAKFCPVLIPWAFELRSLHDRLSPSIFRIHDDLQRRNPDALNWKVITSIVRLVPQAVLRNRVKRRYCSAFGKALESQGYHNNGSPRQDAMDASKEPLPPLKGTLEIYLFSKDPLTDPFPTLVAESVKIIDAIKRHQTSSSRPPQNGKRANPSQEPLIRRIERS